MQKQFFYTVVFTADSVGGYTAEVPALPGCISEGDTLAEAEQNIAEAMELYLESLRADGELPPQEIEVIERRIPVFA